MPTKERYDKLKERMEADPTFAEEQRARQRRYGQAHRDRLKSDPEAHERLRIYNRERKRRLRASKERRVVEAKAKKSKRDAKAARMKKPQPVPVKRAPADLRAAWRRSHPNSVIKQKYPTMAKLEAAYAAGEFATDE